MIAESSTEGSAEGPGEATRPARSSYARGFFVWRQGPGLTTRTTAAGPTPGALLVPAAQPGQRDEQHRERSPPQLGYDRDLAVQVGRRVQRERLEAERGV